MKELQAKQEQLKRRTSQKRTFSEGTSSRKLEEKRRKKQRKERLRNERRLDYLRRTLEKSIQGRSKRDWIQQQQIESLEKDFKDPESISMEKNYKVHRFKFILKRVYWPTKTRTSR